MTLTNLKEVTSVPETNVTTLFSNDFAAIIVTEVQHSVRKSRAKYPSLDVSELESFLVSEIFNELLDKPEGFVDIRMVKRLAGLRTIDYIRGESKHNHVKVITEPNGQKVTVLDNVSITNPDIETSNLLNSFRATLTDKQNQILELVTSGYGNNEICEMLNVSINTPRNTMKKLKELALDFGLYL